MSVKSIKYVKIITLFYIADAQIAHKLPQLNNYKLHKNRSWIR